MKDGTNQVNMKRVTAINVKGVVTSIVVPDPQLEQLQAAVGGDIEIVPEFTRFQGKPCVAYMNENGKHLRLPTNKVASDMWHAVAPRWSEDTILGNIIIVQTIQK